MDKILGATKFTFFFMSWGAEMGTSSLHMSFSRGAEMGKSESKPERLSLSTSSASYSEQLIASLTSFSDM